MTAATAVRPITDLQQLLQHMDAVLHDAVYCFVVPPAGVDPDAPQSNCDVCRSGRHEPDRRRIGRDCVSAATALSGRLDHLAGELGPARRRAHGCSIRRACRCGYQLQCRRRRASRSPVCADRRCGSRHARAGRLCSAGAEFLSGRESCVRADAFRLQQMPILVPGQDFETRSHRKTNQRHKRIPKAHPIDVVGRRLVDQPPRRDVAGKKAIEDRRINRRRRHNLRRCLALASLRRWFDDRDEGSNARTIQV